MKKVLTDLRILLPILCLFAIIISAVFGFQRFRSKEIMKQELNLDGLFVNIQGVDIKTSESNPFDTKPYDKIVVKIPSISSKNDDITDEKEAKEAEVNQVINREKLDQGFTNWLKKVYNEKIGSTYTNEIEIWYRDYKVIDENYK